MSAYNNDYVNSAGVCCWPSADGNLATKSIPVSDDNYEKLQYYYHPDHLGSASYITNLDGEVVQHIIYTPWGEVFCEERNNTWNTPFLFNGKELDEETGLYYYGARYYNPRVSLWYGVDPMFDKYPSMSPYNYCANNPIILVDREGESPTLITGAIGAVAGALIGGGIEIGKQLWTEGSVTDWSAVGGGAVQGLITGGAAGLTGGASLAVTAGVAGAANAVGGTVNRSIQGEETTVTDVAIDASIGAVLGAGGKIIGGASKEAVDDLSNAAKGKIGEAASQVKYGAKGYVSKGKDIVATGGKTATGRPQVAKYDHNMTNIITGKKITVESKFNTSRLTGNQKAAWRPEFILDRTTSQEIGNAVGATATGVGAGISSQTNSK
ncbi:MAG: RHS repeat domain-containing protein [Mangrovibacterium sp.]